MAYLEDGPVKAPRTICIGPKCFAKPAREGAAFCASCWARVPLDLQELVADTWIDPPGEEHRRALRSAAHSLERPLTD